MTFEGNIMVDGILASCYASSDHDLGNILMAPIHWFPDIVEVMFGDDKGSSAYANILTDWGKYVLPYGNKYGMN